LSGRELVVKVDIGSDGSIEIEIILGIEGKVITKTIASTAAQTGMITTIVSPSIQTTSALPSATPSISTTFASSTITP